VASADLLLHPVRLRVVQAFLGGRELTTADLRAALPDVPAATLYRHVGTLAGAGVLEVVGERRVRGAAERTYRLRTEAATVDRAELATMDADAHRRAFTAFVAGLLADHDRWLDRPGPPDAVRDGVGYRQLALWLSDAELAAFAAELRELQLRWLEREPGEGRRRRLVSTVVLPGDPPEELPGVSDPDGCGR
jgi:DNA-binding transcriptional ArsR family regulator